MEVKKGEESRGEIYIGQISFSLELYNPNSNNMLFHPHD